MRFLVLVVALALTGCTMGGLGGGLLGGHADKGKASTAANPITGGEVSVTALSGPPGALPAGAKPAGAAPDGKAPPPKPAGPAPAPQNAAAPPAKPPAQSSATAAPPEAAPSPPPPPPPPPLSPEEAACRKKGGQWANVGKVAHTCVQPTRDGGKSCSKASQCDGLCLARSRSCAPIKPLFGCNEILQDDGSQVTLCID